jgi:hypothetical protein
MIKDVDTARGLCEDLLRLNGLLDESIVKAMPGCTAEELRAYKRWVGTVMCSVFEDVLEPIYRGHPDLKPPEWD